MDGWRPKLTTVRQDFASVGVRAVEAITSAIAESEPQAPSLITPELLIRRSTGPTST